MDGGIPETIQKQLEDVFGNEPETFSRALFFLLSCSKEEREPYIRSLQRLLGRGDLFESTARRLAEDTKKVEKDPEFRQMMHDIWNKFMKEDNEGLENSGQEWALAVPTNNVVCTTQTCFMNAVGHLKPEQLTALQSFIQTVDGTGVFHKCLQRAIESKAVVKVSLVVCFLAYDVIRNIRRWWNDEISGTRCVKNVIDCGVSVAAGIAGGVGGEILGMSIGSLAGPVGGILGAIAGAFIGSACATTAAQSLSDRLTQWVFGLPKSEALENAYLFLELPPSSSNSEINTKYRQLALRYHPDKDGDRDKWTHLQYSLAVIREARE